MNTYNIYDATTKVYLGSIRCKFNEIDRLAAERFAGKRLDIRMTM